MSQPSLASLRRPLPHAPAHTRDAALDLIKWLAIITMLIDHLRYAAPGFDWTYIPGRLSFPLFCVAIAANIARTRNESIVLPWRYLGWMLVFSVVSEWPYRLLVPFAQTINIMPTLALGLLVTHTIAHPKGWAVPVGTAALATGLYFGEYLQYGAPGMLLIPACYYALLRPRQCWVLPIVPCLAANYWPDIYEAAGRGDLSAWVVIALCGLPPVLGIWLLRCRIPFKVPPVGRWAYLFYPAHLFVLAGIASLFLPVV
ncbi:TraX family protein [Pseudomonas sp. Marseille-QA0892]